MFSLFSSTANVFHIALFEEQSGKCEFLKHAIDMLDMQEKNMQSIHMVFFFLDCHSSTFEIAKIKEKVAAVDLE